MKYLMNITSLVLLVHSICFGQSPVDTPPQAIDAGEAGVFAPVVAATNLNLDFEEPTTEANGLPATHTAATEAAHFELLNDYGLEHTEATCDALATCDTCPQDCGGSCCRQQCPPWAHRSGVHAGFLYLRARDADISYAAVTDGPVVPPPASPIVLNPLGTVDPDYQPGFFAGISSALNVSTSIDVRYTFFESSTDDSIDTNAPLALRSLVVHPSTVDAATDFLDANASLDIDFDLIDVDFRRVIWCGDLHAVNVVLGARYAQLDQRFESEFNSLGTTNVNTDIDFDGGGIRVGLDGQFFGCGKNLSIYSRGVASFLGGRFRGEYFQGSTADPVVVATDWEAGRIVPILDFELGVRFDHKQWNFGAGYLISTWFNTPDTSEWINTVQTGNYTDVDGTLSFDGLKVHLAYNW